MSDKVISMGIPLVETIYQINKVLKDEGVIILRTIVITQANRNTPIEFELRNTPDSSNSIEPLRVCVTQQSGNNIAGASLDNTTIDCRKVKLELVVRPSKKLTSTQGNCIELTYSRHDSGDNYEETDFPNFVNGEIINPKIDTVHSRPNC